MGILKAAFGRIKQSFHRRSPAQQWLLDVLPKKSTLHNSLAEEYRDSPIATACGELIVKSVTDLPWKVGRMDKGQFVETPGSALSKLINKPNGQQNRDTFLKKTIRNLLIEGEASILPMDSASEHDSKPKNLYSISRRGVSPEEGAIEGHVSQLVYTPRNGKREKLSPKQILFLRFAIDPVDQFRGFGPMQAAVLSVATGRKNIAWINGLAENMGIPPATLQFGKEDFAAVMSDQMQATLRKTWGDKVIGPGNAGMPFVTTGTVKPLAFSPVEASVVNLLDVSEGQVEKAFNVPPVLVGDLRFSSYANAREANTNFTLRNILPFGWFLAKEITQFLQTWFPNEVLWIEVKDIEVLQEDYKKRTEAIAIQVKSGIISPNRGAIELDYEEQDSDGDKRIVEGTMGPLSGATDEMGHGEVME